MQTTDRYVEPCGCVYIDRMRLRVYVCHVHYREACPMVRRHVIAR
jgi:hypothetical protein